MSQPHFFHGLVDEPPAAMEQAVFVGAIQTQGLALSFNDNATPLKVATNNIFFIGILLNVGGAYFALITASSLEADLSELKAFFQSKTDQQLATIAQLPLSSLARRFVNSQCIDRNVIYPAEHSQSLPCPPEDMFADTTLERLCLSITRNKNAGILGDVAIYIGFTTCLVAFLCLAQATQPAAVRITTPAIVGILLLLRAVIHYIPALQARKPGRRQVA